MINTKYNYDRLKLKPSERDFRGKSKNDLVISVVTSPSLIVAQYITPASGIIRTLLKEENGK